jgi:hypothetical protein
MILIGLSSAQPRPLRGASRGVVEAGRTEGGAGEQALSSSVAGAGGNPGPRPVRRPRAWSRKPRHSGGVGAPPGGTMVPCQELADGRGLGRKPNRLRSKARPGAGRKTPRWSAERRAGQRHWPVISGEPEIGPTAKRVTGCSVPHPAPPSALPPLISARDGKKGKGDPGRPSKNPSRRGAERWLNRDHASGVSHQM